MKLRSKLLTAGTIAALGYTANSITDITRSETGVYPSYRRRGRYVYSFTATISEKVLNEEGDKEFTVKAYPKRKDFLAIPEGFSKPYLANVLYLQVTFVYDSGNEYTSDLYVDHNTSYEIKLTRRLREATGKITKAKVNLMIRGPDITYPVHVGKEIPASDFVS